MNVTVVDGSMKSLNFLIKRRAKLSLENYCLKMNSDKPDSMLITNTNQILEQ